MSERDDGRRLACYDAMAQRLFEPPVSAPARAPAATVPESTPAEAVSRAATAAPAPAATDDGDRDETLVARVVRVFQQPRGEHVVELDNGQLWQQDRASRYFPVEEGDEITVRKQFFGGYRLVTTSGKGYRVERIR